MKASNYLKLAEKDWMAANMQVLILLDEDIGEAEFDEMPCIDEPDGTRADADLAREVEDKLEEVADRRDLPIKLLRATTSQMNGRFYDKS